MLLVQHLFATQIQMGKTLYNSIQSLREADKKPQYRIMIAGYLNDELVKHENVDFEAMINESRLKFKQIRGYLYIKGLFYIHLMENENMGLLNGYMEVLLKMHLKQPGLHDALRVVHQTYQDFEKLFRGWECDNGVQTGPTLSETEKTEEQITDRAAEILEIFEEGARKKMENQSHKIGTMILLSNDDMSMLISQQFMSLHQYGQLYLEDLAAQRQDELNFPLSPNLFKMIEFMEIDNYQLFASH